MVRKLMIVALARKLACLHEVVNIYVYAGFAMHEFVSLCIQPYWDVLRCNCFFRNSIISIVFSQMGGRRFASISLFKINVTSS